MTDIRQLVLEGLSEARTKGSRGMVLVRNSNGYRCFSGSAGTTPVQLESRFGSPKWEHIASFCLDFDNATIMHYFEEWLDTSPRVLD